MTAPYGFVNSAPSPESNHWIIELYGADNLENCEAIAHAMKTAASKAGATVLDCKLHHFGENQGVTGVALLAESHISIHTWPEFRYAAIDVFMCGSTNPKASADHLKEFFNAEDAVIQIIPRGRNLDMSAPDALGL
ncbi:MAG TPA: adenosylmethionine decarboxylase [Rhizobiales bacterium]|nr:adenosylmethionine decarboxylase [Hyphomicrobiales bacterium]